MDKKKYVFESEIDLKACWEGCRFYNKDPNEFDNLCLVSNDIDPRDVSHYIYPCPIKELKPKQLDFQDAGYNCHSHRLVAKITSHNALPEYDTSFFPLTKKEICYYIYVDERGAYKGEYYAGCYYTSTHPNFRFAFSDPFSSIEEAFEEGKRLCQEHYNKIFYEMIGE